MNFLARIALRRAAKAYAKHLPGELGADWGASSTYTVDQVRTAIERRDLQGRHVALAYAALLTEADYLRVAPSLPLVLPYDIARDAFQRAKPWGDKFTEQRDAETTPAPPMRYP